MASAAADKALFRRAGRMREQGKRPTAIARELGVSSEKVASLLWKYDNTTTNLEHGKRATYQYYGCRCVPCTTAASNQGAEYREELRRHPERVKHGTFTSFYGVGCRCPECRDFGVPLVEKYIAPLVPDAPRNGHPWTDAEVEAIRDYSKTAKELAAELGRTPVAVKAERRRMWRDTFAS